VTEPTFTLDSTFRCEKFSCVLAVKHCLRRQHELVRRMGKGGADNPKPLHEYCSSGNCDQGNQHRSAFSSFTHQQSDPREDPRLDLVHQEPTVSSSPTKRLCSACKKTPLFPNNKSGIFSPCQTGYRAKKDGHPQPRLAPKAPRTKLIKARPLFDVEEATVEQLVETIEACREQLAARKEAVTAQLESIQKALGGALHPDAGGQPHAQGQERTGT
jgi:hypothetical protein